MIRAAALYGEHSRSPVLQSRDRPPLELSLVFQFRTWGALPRAGGLLDQPAGLLERMSIAWTVYDAFRQLYSEPRSSEWRAMHPEVMDIIRWANSQGNKENYG